MSIIDRISPILASPDLIWPLQRGQNGEQQILGLSFLCFDVGGATLLRLPVDREIFANGIGGRSYLVGGSR